MGGEGSVGNGPKTYAWPGGSDGIQFPDTAKPAEPAEEKWPEFMGKVIDQAVFKTLSHDEREALAKKLKATTDEMLKAFNKQG